MRIALHLARWYIKYVLSNINNNEDMTILMNVIPNTIIILKFSLLLCLFNLFKLNIIIPINTIYDINFIIF